MEDDPLREKCDTGLSKIRSEIKHRLVTRGLFGSITAMDVGAEGQVSAGSEAAATVGIADRVKIEIVVKGKTAGRSFDRRQIEDCRLRVSSLVLAEIIAMIDELST
jgi:hypothetical protein